ncbi:YaeQ family protein [Paucibacter sp. XJ19-41]|uniref:YaeQ family protein n=1 Tax=Paucibacter sp. XJ19-41 TaxID=2927824 RepID=UPI0023494F8A|nr:YaeQ family protein [Paucibacter sp. XJ19-41]MDC6168260.1 YaeQ family protein [Paucibacter sp. XJ19-41]
MALKATIHKALVQIADMDRHVYGDHNLTIARHPSETDERMMIRVLAFALHTPADDLNGRLEFTKGLSDVDEPDLWQLSLTGEVLHWIDLGQPDDRRLMKAHGKANKVTVIGFASSTPVWWAGIENKLTRAPRLSVWQIPYEQSQALARLAERSMQLQVSVQDGGIYVSTAQASVEITPIALKVATE